MSDRPTLFRLGKVARVAATTAPSIATPLGRLTIHVEVDGAVVRPVAAFAAGERTVVAWPDPARFEMLLTRPPPSLPPGMAVDGAVAVIWRAGPSCQRDRAVISCLWTGESTWAEVGPESGQYLDAQTWTDGRTRVTVGLPDFGTATTYRRDGFLVAVGQVAVGQGHFICAWSPDAPDEISTWFAVDWPTDRLVGPEPAAPRPRKRRPD